MSKEKKPMLFEVVGKWRALLNSNAQAALGEADMNILLEILGAWIKDVTGELREADTAYVGPEEIRELRVKVRRVIVRLDRRGER